MPKAYDGQKPKLEDFQAILPDNFEVREKSYSWLTVPQIRDFEIEMNLPKELRDDGELLHLTYKEKGIDKKPLSSIRWSRQEEVDVYLITQNIIKRTKQWLSLRIRSSSSKGKQKDSILSQRYTGNTLKE